MDTIDAKTGEVIESYEEYSLRREALTFLNAKIALRCLPKTMLANIEPALFSLKAMQQQLAERYQISQANRSADEDPEARVLVEANWKEVKELVDAIGSFLRKGY